MAFAKGAPEVILAASTSQLTRDGEAPLDDAARRAVLDEALAMARQALRVLAVARKRDTDARGRRERAHLPRPGRHVRSAATRGGGGDPHLRAAPASCR